MLTRRLCAGVPKFFRWLTERYPLTKESISGTCSVDIDNLYLDMNGIIHNCTHANEARVNATEQEMIRKCFLYIERLVRIAKPRKTLFMAIDGAHCISCLSCCVHPLARPVWHQSVSLRVSPPRTYGVTTGDERFCALQVLHRAPR